MEHHILALDSWIKPLPPLSFPHKLTYSSPSPSPSHTTATLLITSVVPVTAPLLAQCPNIQLVACNGTGTDHIDIPACSARGIAVAHVPAQNTDSVSEHAFALYFAVRRRVVPMHRLTVEGREWVGSGGVHLRVGVPPPRTNGEERVVVVGYGALGRRIVEIGRALGMNVVVAERKGVKGEDVREGRIAFDEAVRTATVFMVVTPLTDESRGMFGKEEFEVMDPTALVINVGRGGVIDEAALLAALKEGKIAGAATDVFETEPATKENSVILREGEEELEKLNLVLSPHIAWYSLRTIKGTKNQVKENLEGFVSGEYDRVAFVLRPDPSKYNSAT